MSECESTTMEAMYARPSGAYLIEMAGQCIDSDTLAHVKNIYNKAAAPALAAATTTASTATKKHAEAKPPAGFLAESDDIFADLPALVPVEAPRASLRDLLLDEICDRKQLAAEAQQIYQRCVSPIAVFAPSTQFQEITLSDEWAKIKEICNDETMLREKKIYDVRDNQTLNTVQPLEQRHTATAQANLKVRASESDDVFQQISANLFECMGKAVEYNRIYKANKLFFALTHAGTLLMNKKFFTNPYEWHAFTLLLEPICNKLMSESYVQLSKSEINLLAAYVDDAMQRIAK